MATGGVKLAYDPARFYAWKAPGDIFAIHLSLGVVEKFNHELMRAAAENPARDIQGVLLGRTRSGLQPASVVEDLVFDTGPEKHGEGFLPHVDTVSDTIWELVRGTGSGRHVVGFFRSQRDGLLTPNDWDLRNASRLLGEPDNVMLLVRFSPEAGNEAALFYWEPGRAQPYFSGPRFPFDAAKLSGAALDVPKPRDPPLLNDPLPLPPPAMTTSPAVEPQVWPRLIPTFGLFVLATLGTQILWLSHTPEVTTAAEMPANAETLLGLSVTARPHQVEIRWNHDSAPIRSAEKAVIRIMEGSLMEVVPIARPDLQDGFVAYTPKTNDVNVHFEVTGSDGSRATESVRVVAIP